MATNMKGMFTVTCENCDQRPATASFGAARLCTMCFSAEIDRIVAKAGVKEVAA